MAKKNYNLLIGIGALVGIVLVIAFVGYLVSKPRPHVIQGEAEATEYRVSCMVPGHVTELYVREGQTVHRGDMVAFIDSPQVRAKLAQANLASAEENLRTATIGFEAGVISTSTVLSAQTAWLSAHSDCLDAGTELQMAAAALRKAEGMK